MRKVVRLKALAAVTLLAGCKMDVLAPAGDVAMQQRDLLVMAVGLMLLVVVPVMALTIFFAWRYRASNTTATYEPDWSHSTKLELVIWSVPLLIIICLGALTWVGTHLLDPYRPLDRISATKPIEAQLPLRVQVVALDWKWLFIYPDQGIASVNDLAVPVDRQVQFSLTSSSVMNAFYIPAMAGMIYAMPGMETKLHGVFNSAGDYQGLSSQFSGAGFSGMRFKAHAVDNAGFDAWVANAKASGKTLGRAEYLALAKPTENVKPAFFETVASDLFDRVVNLCVDDGKMCMAEMAALDAKGGTGLAGAYNVVALTYGRGQTALGPLPVMVTSICTPADAVSMFGKMSQSLTSATDPNPMRGHGLPQPLGWFDTPPLKAVAVAAASVPSSDL